MILFFIFFKHRFNFLTLHCFPCYRMTPDAGAFLSSLVLLRAVQQDATYFNPTLSEIVLPSVSLTIGWSTGATL